MRALGDLDDTEREAAIERVIQLSKYGNKIGWVTATPFSRLLLHFKSARVPSGCSERPRHEGRAALW
jgi:hypothetical protein